MNNENVTTRLTGVIEPLIKLLTPSLCIICNEQNFILCSACQEEHLLPIFPTCYVCKSRSDDYSTCNKCRKQRARPKNVWAVTGYDGYAKKLIYKMKFDSNREIAKFIAESLNNVVPWMDFDVVTYVPGASKRIRQRGFDHTKSVARHLAGLRKLKFEKLLLRIDNSRQLGMSGSQRRKQAQMAYRYYPSSKIKYRDVLLIDDVISTGSTIEACTSLLRKNGVKNVYVACFAIN